MNGCLSPAQAALALSPKSSQISILGWDWGLRGSGAWQIPTVHECIAQVSKAQRHPTIVSPVRCTPAADGRCLRYTSALHRSQHPNSAPRSPHLCAAHPLRMVDPYGTRVHCTGLNTPTLPHDRVTCALHPRRGSTHSRKPAWQVTVRPPGHRQADAPTEWMPCHYGFPTLLNMSTSGFPGP